MTTITRTDTRTTSRLGMPGWARMLQTETLLYLRDPGNGIFVLIFPTVLLLGISYFMPGMREPLVDAGPQWTGVPPAHFFAPVMISVAIATAGLTALPNYLASYRETGVLRRLSTTPMRPQGLLLAQLVVNAAALVVGSALAIGLGMALLDVPMPRQLLLTLAVTLLAAAATFGIGMIIGGVVDKATTAGGIGMIVYFPMLFLSGLWTPGPAMPDSVAQVATYTPLGAASQALMEAWFGDGMPWRQLLVMALWAAVTFVVASRTFRWR